MTSTPIWKRYGLSEAQWYALSAYNGPQQGSCTPRYAARMARLQAKYNAARENER